MRIAKAVVNGFIASITAILAMQKHVVGWDKRSIKGGFQAAAMGWHGNLQDIQSVPILLR
jgi:hypothetical protein